MQTELLGTADPFADKTAKEGHKQGTAVLIPLMTPQQSKLSCGYDSVVTRLNFAMKSKPDV